MDGGRKWFVNFNAEKAHLISFDRSITGAIDMKMDVSILEEKLSFKTCVRYFLSNFYFQPNGSPLNTMKNIFYFI